MNKLMIFILRSSWLKSLLHEVFKQTVCRLIYTTVCLYWAVMYVTM